MAFILGSGSPRRLDLLAQLGVQPDAICAPDIDETPLKGELPVPYCHRITRAKVDAIQAGSEDITLCADTTVALGRRILGKPESAGQAAEFLHALSGRRHRVITSVAVRRGERVLQREVVSQVRVKRRSDVEINVYLSAKVVEGPDGCYALPGRAGALLPSGP